jgi:nucleoside phosphorylase
VITPLEEEWAAIRRHFPEARRLPPDDSDVRVYFQAAIPVTLPGGSPGTYQVTFVSPLGMGQIEATTATNDAIHRWQPRYVALVGIAGGVAGRVALGDVLIADQCVDYELQKLRPDAQEVRYKLHPADARLQGAVRYVEDWETRPRVARPVAGKPRRHLGPVITGNKVLADGKTIERYLQDWPKLIGVEMEAGGVAASAFQAASKPGVLMVRGVSDLANADKDSTAVGDWRDYACDVAAAFLRALLESGPVSFSAPTAPTSEAESRPGPGPLPSTTAAKGPSAKQVSALLYEVLRSGSTFDAFCLDTFSEVYRRFGGGMDREARHNMLLTEHSREEIVAALREYDPEKFDRYAPKHLSLSASPAPARPETSGAPVRPTDTKARVRVSCFFAQEDAAQVEELRRHLGPLLRSGKLDYWSVSDIQAGEVRDVRIRTQLETADLLLFMASADLFADSDASNWLERALQRRQKQGTPVIPILLRPTLLASSPLRGLMPLPADGRAVSQWRSRDEAWVEVIQGLQRLL